MANEIRISLGVIYNNVNVRDTLPSRSYSFTQATQQLFTKLWDVGTAEESLATSAFGDIGAANVGFVVLYNTDATNYCEVGTATGVYPFKLAAGEIMLLAINGSQTLFLKSNTSATKILLKAYAR